MILTINHTTRYRYENPGNNAVQKLRLTPQDSPAQTIIDWTVEAPGIEQAAIHTDGFGNIVHLIAQANPAADSTIAAIGRVETRDTGGVHGLDKMPTNPRVFLNATPLTQTSPAIDALAEQARQIAGDSDVTAQLHALMGLISKAVIYRTDTTDAGTSAAEAVEAGQGVCQDHTHIVIAAARFLDIPARYITGYLYIVGEDQPAMANHAWAEAFVPDLGWVGFDPSNGICPTEHYLRLACGLDAVGAAPITGVRRGSSDEILTVDVAVNQQQQ